MSKYLLLLILPVVLLASACGNELSSGTVIDKEDHPAHYESYLAQQYAGEDCHYDSYTKSENCTPRYIWVERQRWVPERWMLKLKQCKQDDSAREKCKKGVAYVSEAIYISTKIGDYYQRAN